MTGNSIMVVVSLLSTGDIYISTHSDLNIINVTRQWVNLHLYSLETVWCVVLLVLSALPVSRYSINNYRDHTESVSALNIGI